MIKPKKLENGQTIAFVAPASGFAALVPHRLDKAKEYFEKQGYKVKVYPTANKISGFSSDTPENRAKDLMDAFKDEEVNAIICTIGGNSSHQILEYLDFELIRNNPKIFCGFSDITSLQLALFKKSDLVTFYGPAAVTQFGDFPEPNGYTLSYFKKSVHGTVGKVSPSENWSDDKSANWMEKEDINAIRKYKPNKGYQWLKEGNAEAEILGGCLPVIMHLKGTEYWPSFKDKILLLETPEGHDFWKGQDLSDVDAFLTNLRIAGVFNEIKGIVFGRGFGYSEEEIKTLKELILKNTKGFDFPILYGVDIGHTDPIITVPLGCKVKIDSAENLFEITESGVDESN